MIAFILYIEHESAVSSVFATMLCSVFIIITIILVVIIVNLKKGEDYIKNGNSDAHPDAHLWKQEANDEEI